jgi:hypothetical protein
MIVELAIATHTAPSAWWDEPVEVLLTASAVLARMHRTR